MKVTCRTGNDRSSIAARTRRVIVLGVLTLAAALLAGSSAQADSIIPGLGGEILGNPGAGPVVPEPNVFPLPPPHPGGPGLVPAPPGPSREVLPVPGPILGVNDGPGSGPTVPPPVHVDADTPPEAAGQPAGAGSAGDQGPVGILTLRPDEVRFSQNSVNDLMKVEPSMRAEGWKGDPIDVVRMPDGKLTTVDNTRLLAAKRTGTDVSANVHNLKDPIEDRIRAKTLASRKGVVPKTWGEAVMIRLRQQNAQYRSAYPMGSPTTGWKGN